MFVAGTGKPRHNHKFQGGESFMEEETYRTLLVVATV